MEIGIVSKEDLEIFRIRLLNDIKELLKVKDLNPEKDWLRSAEVRKKLAISAGTLQNLRISGKLRSSKINGTYYYKSKEIDNLLESSKK